MRLVSKEWGESSQEGRDTRTGITLLSICSGLANASISLSTVAFPFAILHSWNKRFMSSSRGITPRWWILFLDGRYSHNNEYQKRSKRRKQGTRNDQENVNNHEPKTSPLLLSGVQELWED